MKAVSNEIFDDLLIGNFMKTTLIDCDSLYPDFTPYVAKYGDNGMAKSRQELKSYFQYYKLNSADYWKDTLNIQTESIIRNILPSDSMIFKAAKNLRDKLSSWFFHPWLMTTRILDQGHSGHRHDWYKQIEGLTNSKQITLHQTKNFFNLI